MIYNFGANLGSEKPKESSKSVVNRKYGASMADLLKSLRIFLALRSIELCVRETLLTIVADMHPGWWDDIPEKIRKTAETNRSNSGEADSHPVNYLPFSQLIEVISPHWENISTGQSSFSIKTLWSLNPIRNAIAHYREITSEDEDGVIAIGKSLFKSLTGDDSKFLESIQTNDVPLASGAPFVFIPELEANHPLDKYFGLINGPMKSLGLSLVTVTNDELNEDAFRRRLTDCTLIWVTNPTQAASFSSVGWFDAVSEEILRGKPALINSTPIDPTSESAADWNRFLAKLGIYVDYQHQLLDEVDYESYPGNIVFKKENESLRDGVLFDGVDEITVLSPYNIRKSSLARNIVCGGPNTQCRDWTRDEFVPIGGAAASCVALSTFEIIPGTPLRVVSIAGETFMDPVEDISGRSYPGLSRNLGFAYNTLEWLTQK
jgi:hypothetical protein